MGRRSKIPYMLWNPKLQKGPSLNPILREENPVHTLTPYFFLRSTLIFLPNYSQVLQVVSYRPIRFKINVPYAFLVSPLCVTCLAFSIPLDFITIIIPRKEHNSYYAPLYILILLLPLFEANIFSSAVYSLPLQQIA